MKLFNLGAVHREKHLEAAQLLGYGKPNASLDDAGKILADTIRKYMQETGIENGLSELGFTSEDLNSLVQGALPQDRVNKLSPRSQIEEDIYDIYMNSMAIYG
ncbi:ADHFE1 [Lepeophtheirus salmonis]|uniref:ADHFE1 n=1 Tax=Lepeophtheirus salmonis TaxID=72036 RepID=A0A7R8HAD8_LEPSM|nr:ADHFE1 [Lepeophtheirus salmonis]CAF2955180.1 ADHFE1 [Lepeophtheirus salmonis]